MRAKRRSISRTTGACVTLLPFIAASNALGYYAIVTPNPTGFAIVAEAHASYSETTDFCGYFDTVYFMAYTNPYSPPDSQQSAYDDCDTPQGHYVQAVSFSESGGLDGCAYIYGSIGEEVQTIARAAPPWCGDLD